MQNCVQMASSVFSITARTHAQKMAWFPRKFQFHNWLLFYRSDVTEGYFIWEPFLEVVSLSDGAESEILTNFWIPCLAIVFSPNCLTSDIFFKSSLISKNCLSVFHTPERRPCLPRTKISFLETLLIWNLILLVDVRVHTVIFHSDWALLIQVGYKKHATDRKSRFHLYSISWHFILHLSKGKNPSLSRKSCFIFREFCNNSNRSVE